VRRSRAPAVSDAARRILDAIGELAPLRSKVIGSRETASCFETRAEFDSDFAAADSSAAVERLRALERRQAVAERWGYRQTEERSGERSRDDLSDHDASSGEKRVLE